MKTWKELRESNIENSAYEKFRHLINSSRVDLEENGECDFLSHHIEYSVDDSGNSTGYVIVDGKSQYRAWEDDCIEKVFMDIIEEEIHNIFKEEWKDWFLSTKRS